MGQSLSVGKKSRRKSRKLFSSQIFTNGNNLSHTFAVIDDEPNPELVNINTASENDLLKVKDIDLELSRNIIKHRKSIGYFQKAEDLVVVPGMGAERLNNIKHYVCVSTKSGIRYSSQSFDSLKSVDSRTTLTRSSKLVNVNVASVFELQLVHGITQEIAAAIVYYRSKRGPFKRLEDLLKIKCIDCIRLDNISCYLTVQNDEEEDISDHEPERQSNHLPLNGNSRKCDTISFCRNGTANGLLASALADIFELLSAYSPRPIVKELFRYSRNERPAFRVASWNLDDFSVEKASNLGVREVVCRTILENGWSILAIQNVENKDALKFICDELNEPKLPRVMEWKNNKNCWKYNTSYNDNCTLGFIYDAKGANEINLICSEQSPPELNTVCDSTRTTFKIGSTEVQILNLKVKADSGADKIQDYLQKLVNTETHCLVCADFGSNTELFSTLENSKLVLPTNVPNQFYLNSSLDHHCTSNFIVNSCFEKYLTGLQGVQRNGLTHLAIPCRWSWGGPVSTFCPIWVEFFVNPS